MRIALVVPPWGPDDIRAKDTRGISGCWPTPGLQYVAAVLRDAGHEILFLEGFFYSNEEMLERIREFRARALGVYVISLLWDKAKPFIERAKEQDPQLFTFIGGHGATAMPESLMKSTSALDAIVIGEGEMTSRELVGALENGEDLKNIRGLLVRDGEGLHRTPLREMMEDLDQLPFPAVDLCEMDRYYPSFEQVSTVPAMQMLASRGCNGSCLYCYKMYGSRIRLRDPVRVVDEIEYYIRNYGTREIKFWDEHFSHDHDHVYEICDEIIRRKVRVRWWVSCRADSVDRPLLRAMKKAGCWCINYGVESGVQKHLDTLMKHETVDQIREAVRLTHSVGIKTHTTYIFGIPGETFEDGLETIEFAKELNSFTVEFFPITPFPGTPLYKGVHKGLFGTMSSALSDQGMLLDRPCFVPFTMTADEIMELRRLAYTRYFLRPGFLLYRLTNIMSPFQLRAIFHGAGSLFMMLWEQLTSLWKKRRSGSRS
ncbi:MAG: B12-binding domain-containing radical SAM protein [Candidatus Fermentibacteraceae bacterium]|nr:B12-binding domain-containing radical SAM protein [Candidatus Fermentibacteraceae bacterium]MBN2609211.1 B12-binding domain-containing radical SAM protein [Candidatus Fermentibacteraceae bacterium]